MSPVTHILAGWALANTTALSRRDRFLVVLAGVAPDADGLGILLDLLLQHAVTPREYYLKFHHVLFHNLLFGISLVLAAYFLSVRRRIAASLVFLSFHLHLLGDLAGSRGLAHDYWGFPYLAPFSYAEVVWNGQWPLNGWQNVAITIGLMLVMLFLAWKRGYSPMEMISERADAAFVGVLRKRFGAPKPNASDK